MEAKSNEIIPDVDDVALSASVAITVQNNVTVSTVELAVGRGVYRNLV